MTHQGSYLVVGTEPHLMEGWQWGEVGGGAKEMQLSVCESMGENFNFSQSHDQWPLQHFKSKCES